MKKTKLPEVMLKKLKDIQRKLELKREVTKRLEEDRKISWKEFLRESLSNVDEGYEKVLINEADRIEGELNQINDHIRVLENNLHQEGRTAASLKFISMRKAEEQRKREILAERYLELEEELNKIRFRVNERNKKRMSNE